ncbi:hypothetical protein [Demequina soli]|uniref:hypothetical protein n=1 Tax=Demequina soli TaxID=1638987 RepID=UPI0007840CF7|nr:hypothetical protein [Demequina soli]
MAPFLAAAAVVVLAVAVAAASAVWVLGDARAAEAERRPVSARIGGLEIDRPEVRAAACAVVWVFALPLYLAARRAR